MPLYYMNIIFTAVNKFAPLDRSFAHEASGLLNHHSPHTYYVIVATYTPLGLN